MKLQLKSLIAGLIVGATVATGIAATATEELSTLYNVKTDGIRIVVDGKEFTCTDANGAVVNPMIYNGTTYIPVRAVSSAFGKAVYWDDEESTVYLGKMDGKLQNPTATFDDLTNIAGYKRCFEKCKNLTDVRSNFYNIAYHYKNYFGEGTNDCCEYLLNKKYSKFKATLFVEEGSTWSDTVNVTIVGDEKILYKSDDFKKTSDAIDIDVDISNIDNFKIMFSGNADELYIAHEGFYQ